MSKSKAGGELHQSIGRAHVFTFECIRSELSHLRGKALTIIDSALPEGQQNKCTKDLVKSAFFDSIALLKEVAVEANPEAYDHLLDEPGSLSLE